jgi:hypothetical protein
MIAALGVAIALSGGLGLVVGIPLAVLAVGLGSFVQRRPRLEADERGLTVVGVVRMVRIPWIEIAGFHMERVGSGVQYITADGGGLQLERVEPQTCLAIERRDGTTVHARVITADTRTGYSSARVEEMVRELSDLWSVAVSTQQAGGPAGMT